MNPHPKAIQEPPVVSTDQHTKAVLSLRNFQVFQKFCTRNHGQIPQYFLPAPSLLPHYIFGRRCYFLNLYFLSHDLCQSDSCWDLILLFSPFLPSGLEEIVPSHCYDLWHFNIPCWFSQSCQQLCVRVCVGLCNFSFIVTSYQMKLNLNSRVFQTCCKSVPYHSNQLDLRKYLSSKRLPRGVICFCTHLYIPNCIPICLPKKTQTCL